MSNKFLGPLNPPSITHLLGVGDSKTPNSSSKIDVHVLPLPKNQLRSMDLRLVEPFDKFFWSEQFFRIHESYLNRLNSQTSAREDAELIDIYFRLSAHAQDFVSTAEKYAKIVISEKTLPFEKKTVKPAREIGGIGSFANAENFSNFRYSWWREVYLPRNYAQVRSG